MDIRVLSFLMFVGIFVATTSFFYSTYSTTMKDYANRMAELEATSRYGPAAPKIVGENLVVPVNFVPAYTAAYGENHGPDYYKVANLIYSKTNTWFGFEVITGGYYNENNGEVGVTIYTIGGDNQLHSAAWINPQTTPCELYIGREYFSGLGILAGVLITAGGTIMLQPEIVAGGLALTVAEGAIQVWPTAAETVPEAWPYDITFKVSHITRVAGHDNFIYGYVTISLKCYGTGGISETFSSLVNTVKGFITGMFGMIFGEYGRQFVNTLSTVLTMDFPGMPTPIRALIAVPINLCIVFILASFIAMFIPFAGGG